jgi:hypothetical protein
VGSNPIGSPKSLSDMKKLLFVGLLFITNLSFSQEIPISSISAGGGLNYYGTMQMNLNLIVHDAYAGYTTDTFNDLRTMEIGWTLHDKKFHDWYVIPTLGVYSENNYNYTRYYLYGVINTNVNGSLFMNTGTVVFKTPEDEQKYLLSKMDQVDKKVGLYPCYGLMIGYLHKDVTYFIKANNKQCSIGFGLLIR